MGFNWKYNLWLIVFFICTKGFSQSNHIWEKKPHFEISGFLDVFYVYDFNRPKTDFRQPFLFNHNRHNEFNLNLAFIKLGLKHEKFRSNFAMQTGTYAIDNYAEEPGLLKNIFEANAGIALDRKNNLWLDAGILPSHIGFESAISMDNWTLTRSLSAENTPYFLTGAKLSYLKNNKWEFAALIINGWQRIRRLEGNSLPSFGTQINFSPVENITLNWSTFLGTDDPDIRRRMRYLNNFYGIFQLSERWGLIARFNYGIQQQSKNSINYDHWFSPALITQYTINSNWKIALRAEYYQDLTGIIIPTETSEGFVTSGFSVNLDYVPVSFIACRLEGRLFKSPNPIFKTPNSFTDSNFFLGTSIAIKFAE